MFEMYRNILICLLFVPLICFSNDLILKQGKVEVKLVDIDGFAYKIPIDVRSGFFGSPERIDKTVSNILTMKLVNNYASENNLINENEIVKRVNDLINKTVEFDPNQENKLQQEIEYKLIKEYMYIEEKFKLFKEYFRNSIDKNNLINLAKEIYEVNKDNYFSEESRNLDYIAFKYNEKNKDEVHKKVQRELQKLISGELNYSDLLIKETNNIDVIVYKGLNNYKNNTKQQEFSEQVFSRNSIGVVKKLIDLDSKYIIISINKINKAGNLKFDVVKDSIINSLYQEKIKREYEHLLLNLTQEKVELNEENIRSLKERYL